MVVLKPVKTDRFLAIMHLDILGTDHFDHVHHKYSHSVCKSGCLVTCVSIGKLMNTCCIGTMSVTLYYIMDMVSWKLWNYVSHPVYIVILEALEPSQSHYITLCG